jgi:MerR family transcriptional regulator, light-induced transcriptional regulator
MTNYTAPGRAARAGPEPALLSISEVSRRTGIPVAGLRNWEQRYGMPRPERLPSGRRRYREADCALLADVVRYRKGGMSIPAAIARATAGAGLRDDMSIFAGLRRRHPDLRVHVMTKTVLLALSRAIEDECCARAQRPVLLGSFQRQLFYQASRVRWADLARCADETLIFADFERSRRRPGGVAEVAVPANSPLRREWALVCDASDLPACLAGWELLGQDRRGDQDRVFEVLWSVEPQVVRSAARIGTSLAATAIPEVAERLGTRLTEEPGPASADLRRASGLIERTLDYLSRSESGQEGP